MKIILLSFVLSTSVWAAIPAQKSSPLNEVQRADRFEEAFKKHQELSRAGAENKFKGGLADSSEETTKLHTATHLLHQALRDVLGDHVGQKGSNITVERLRFDFNNDDPMTPEQIAEVEKIVNSKIDADFRSISYKIRY